jgi:16S rRNA (cytosine1402-N4)-methyltransferase
MPGHQPVLVGEALDGLALLDDGWYVDATYGRGGHSAEILARLGAQGRLLALDKDPEAVADGRRRFATDSRFTIHHAGFEDLGAVVGHALGARKLAGVLFDLGVSSPQLEESRRGFSFAHDGPLDMRMNTSSGQTAAEWLRDVGQADLLDVLRRYGEEPRARQIAAAIVRARAQAPLATTRQLADLVAAHAGRQKTRTHPATRVFQAIRIAINSELAALERGLAQSVALLGEGGRLVVISFHSLEDRIVKRFMQREARGDEAYAGLPNIPPHARPRLDLVGRLVRPSAQEVARNPRSRSARLRVAARTATEQPA